MSINKGLLIQMALVALLFAVGVYLVLLMTGPDMKVQQSLTSYDARMPVLPEDSVPAQPGLFFPSERQAGKAATPNMARGKFAYDAYCVFCHGEKGDGEGPVGQSFAPGPGDLRTDKVRAMNDQPLLRAMLTGTGHDPVLPRVVPPDDRSSLLLYVRTLIQGQKPERPSASNVLP